MARQLKISSMNGKTLIPQVLPPAPGRGTYVFAVGSHCIADLGCSQVKRPEFLDGLEMRIVTLNLHGVNAISGPFAR